MPLFVCNECDHIENTAYGVYFGREFIKFFNTSKNNKALCRNCTPTQYEDGSLVRKKAHYIFETFIATEQKIQEMGLDQFIYLGKFSYLFKKERSR